MTNLESAEARSWPFAGDGIHHLGSSNTESQQSVNPQSIRQFVEFILIRKFMTRTTLRRARRLSPLWRPDSSASRRLATTGRSGCGDARAETVSYAALSVEKVRDNLFVIRGAGGNVAAFVTGAGVVMVDSGLPGWGQLILDKLKTVTTSR